MEEISYSMNLDSSNVGLVTNREDCQRMTRDLSLNSVLEDVTDVAAMAFGHGVGEGVKGGKGHIGFLNGRVVKFNVTRVERQALVKGSAAYDAMLKASDTLRCRLIMNLETMERYFTGKGGDGKEAGFNPATVAEFRVLQKNLANLLGAQLNMVVEEGETYQFSLPKRENEINRGEESSEPAEFKYGLSVEPRMLEENRGLLDRSAAAKAVTLIRDFLMQHAATPQTTAKDSALLKGAFAAEAVPLDLHIWRKVKSMHTTSRSVGSDGFAYARAVGNAMKDVTRFVQKNGEHLRAFGNAAAKDELLSVQIKPESNELGTKFTLKTGTEEITGLDVKQAKGMARLHRDLVLAKSMDVMFKEMLNLRGLADQRPAALRALGETPFQDMLKRSLAAVLGRQPTDVADLLKQKVWLTPNEHRNMLALLRKEVLTFVADLGNERQEGPAGADGRLSTDVMIAKDLLLQLSKVFRVDQDDTNCKLDLVEENKTKSVRNDNFFPANSAGSYMYKETGIEIFTVATYCQVNEVAIKVDAEDAVRKGMKETLAAHLLDDFSAEKLQLSNKAGVQDGRPLVPVIPENKREAAKAVMQSVLGKLVDRYGLPTKDELAAVRESFCEEMANVLIAADDGGERPSINTRVRNVLADHETKEFLRTLFGTSFDVKIATLFAKDAFGLRTDYAPEELGAGTDARYRSEVTGGSTFNAGQVVQDVKDACRGKDYRKAFALALNRFSEQAQGLKDATNVQKADYLVALGQMRRLLGQTDIAQKRSEDVRYALQNILHGMPHRLDAKLKDQFDALMEAVSRHYPATKEQQRHYDADMANEIARMQRGHAPAAVGAPENGAPEAAEGFNDEDRGTIDEIAAYAYGSHEGTDGGEGYLGVYNGAMAKFLTHSDERKDIGKDVTGDQRTAINDATAALRDKLTALAAKLPEGAEKTQITNLLAPNPTETAAHNGLDLLSRKTVAQVVTLLAEGAKKTGQTLFSWKGLEPADTVADTSFKTVLNRGTLSVADVAAYKEKALKRINSNASEIDKRIGEDKVNERGEVELDIKGKPLKVKDSGAAKYRAFIEMLTNPAAVDVAAAEVDAALRAMGRTSLITSCHDEVVEDAPIADLNSQFKVSDKYTVPTQRAIEKTGTEAKKTSMLVFADGHFWGGGLAKAFVSQEEVTLGEALDPRLAAWMLKKGMIKLSVYNEALGFEYVNLSTVDGGYILTDPFSGKNFAFHSMPSEDVANKTNHDILGDSNWTCVAEEYVTGRKVSSQERANAYKFVEEFYKQVGEGAGFPEVERALQDTIEYLMFARDYEHCDVFAHRRAEEVTKAVKSFVAFAIKQLKTNPEAFRARARTGYTATVGKSFAKLVAGARKVGVKEFVGGLGGTGAFANDARAVGGAMSLGFRSQGGDMIYHYPAGSDINKEYMEGFGLEVNPAAQKA